jgi:hypothetical protein
MTYLELVNGVLTRLREDPISTLAGEDDVVAVLVADLVNDAKSTVETSHNWSALRHEWPVTTVADTSVYTLEDSRDIMFLESATDANGQTVEEMRNKELRVRARSHPAAAKPTHYSVSGASSVTGDKEVTLHPTPNAAYDLYFDGHRAQARLSADNDRLLVPSQPVLYFALSLAARERGEVGGQTAAELFQMAGGFLADAIARDAELNYLDDIWQVS